jgi:hypothetical protein
MVTKEKQSLHIGEIVNIRENKNIWNALKIFIQCQWLKKFSDQQKLSNWFNDDYVLWIQQIVAEFSIKIPLHHLFFL